MKIKLKCGGEAIIDADDYNKISAFKWRINDLGYVQKASKDVVFMHHFVLGVKPMIKKPIDHINRIKTDNRKKNLRITSCSINALNKCKHPKPSSSKFKGVSKVKTGWVSYITVNRKRSKLGVYDNELEAARAYNLFCIKNIKEDVFINKTGDNYKNFIPFPKEKILFHENVYIVKVYGGWKFIPTYNEGKLFFKTRKTKKEAIFDRFVFFLTLRTSYEFVGERVLHFRYHG
ncbi:MAG: hypothetical protein HRT87_09165 [Legionellales bacterium]|nr:hypothetical protein [Legionellales bacterium]